MHSKNAAKVAQTFLDTIWSDKPPDSRLLAAAVDHLLSSSHHIVEPIGRKVRSRLRKGDVFSAFEQWSGVYELLRVRFPDYGNYAVARPPFRGPAAYMTGDAIDDLADITKDLREVVWREEHFGPDEAAWHFRFSYETRWGSHAREIALYLHARIARAGR